MRSQTVLLRTLIRSECVSPLFRGVLDGYSIHAARTMTTPKQFPNQVAYRTCADPSWLTHIDAPEW